MRVTVDHSTMRNRAAIGHSEAHDNVVERHQSYLNLISSQRSPRAGS
jgi:hypothetical protein